MLTSPPQLDFADVVLFNGADWHRCIPEDAAEEERQEAVEREGKAVFDAHSHYLDTAPSTCLLTPPTPTTTTSSSAFSSPTASEHSSEPSPSPSATSFDLRFTPTTHWLFSGRVPSHIPPPPARHRKTRSLTLSLTADPSSPVRSLTHDAPESGVYDAMALAPPPGSPPELTSSKSSSVRSSSLSAADAAADLAHFEDIGLDDENARPAAQPRQNSQRLRSLAVPLGQQRKQDAASLRRTSGPAATGRNHSPAFPPMRELVNGTRPISPAPLSAPLKSEFSRGSSLGAPLRAGLSSSSTTSLARVAMRNRSRSPSRSPSPTAMQGPLSAPLRGGAPHARGQFPPRTSSRRSSATAVGALRPRKSAAEIEAQFQELEEGGDDELPEEASLWNVPLSPALYRTASSVVSSGRSSAVTSTNTSPERRPSPAITPRAAAFDRRRRSPMVSPSGAPRTAPLASRPFPRRSDSHLSAGRPLARAGTTGHMPEPPGRGKGRAKSWDVVLGEMSDEAKTLSELLDQHETEANGRESSADPASPEQDQSTIPSSPPPTLARSRTSPMPALPPLRRNEALIDPLPVSKEKEAVLSRTRPSWLPPKDRREEKRHLKEYQRMMAASQDAEKKREAKAESSRAERDDTSAALTRIWTQHVLPDLGAAMAEPRTRELWWRGIPPAVRPEAWRRGIGNELGLTPTTYAKALERVRAVEAKAAEATALGAAEVQREISWFAALDSDTRRAFPQLRLFQAGQPLHGALRDVLRAYACYRADVGRVPGAHLAAALLVLVLPSAAEAFTALANLLNRPLPLAFLTGDASGVHRTFALVRRALAAKRPALDAHLFGALRLTEAEVLEPLLRTLFLGGCCEAWPPGSGPASPRASASPSPAAAAAAPRGRGLSLPLALRLWDVLVFDGDRAIIRAAVGVLCLAEPRLYGGRAEVLDVLGWGGALGLDAAEGPAATDPAAKRDSSGSSVGGVEIGAGQWDDEVERAVDVVRDAGRADKARD